MKEVSIFDLIEEKNKPRVVRILSIINTLKQTQADIDSLINYEDERNEEYKRAISEATDKAFDCIVFMCDALGAIISNDFANISFKQELNKLS